MFSYALISATRKYTYIGKTNNLVRRLRQHNGLICGGAKYTRKGRPWSVYLFVSGFQSTSQALCFEWAWKHNRARGIGGVVKGLQKVCNKDRWTKKCPLASTIPLTIHTTEMDRLQNIKLPSYVTIDLIERKD